MIFKKYLFVWLCGVLAVAYTIFSYTMWELALSPDIAPRPSALGTGSLSHWTTREGPFFFFFAAPQGLWDLSSLTRDWTRALEETYPLDCQEIPSSDISWSVSLTGPQPLVSSLLFFAPLLAFLRLLVHFWGSLEFYFLDNSTAYFSPPRVALVIIFTSVSPRSISAD